MKINLDQLEARLQTLIEGSAARLFSFGKPHKEIGLRLVAAMRANLHTQVDGSVWAPNLYTIVAHPSRRKALEADRPLLDELAHLLEQAGREADLIFPEPPQLRIADSPDIAPYQVNILAQYNLDHLNDTDVLDPGMVAEREPAIPGSAFLIVNGSQIYPLVATVTNIGRGEHNQLILDDLRVSRSHAQLRLVSGRFVIFDLDSTGGTFVNEQRVNQSVLLPGDVISLAGVPVIFGQDGFAAGGQTEPYNPDTHDSRSSPDDPEPNSGRTG